MLTMETLGAMMKSAAAYLESLSQLNRRVFVNGQQVEDVLAEPKCRPAAEAVAMTYALAETDRYRDLAQATSSLTGEPVNRFTHLFTTPEDLVLKIKLQRVLGQLTGTCFQRCVGLDAMNALAVATWENGPQSHRKFLHWLEGVQRRDEVICGAMTDAKGNRRKRPGEQPDCFLRVVKRQKDGVIIRGVKLHQTGALNAHQILFMPGLGLRPGEEMFAIAGAVSVEAPGLTFVLGRQPSDDRKGTSDAGNIRYGGQEALIIFDDVFIKSEHLFLDGEIDCATSLMDVFSTYHRASYGGCKPGNLDVLIGAVTALVEQMELRTSSQVRDKLVEMVYLTESISGLGLAASHQSHQHPSGQWLVDKTLANVCKQAVTRLPYEVGRIAEDLAGGLVSTMPEMELHEHPEIGKWMHLATGGVHRASLLRLVEYMTYGSGSVPLRIECMHGAGSPAAQRIALQRCTPWEEKISMATRLLSF
jgi:4-hydroxybutyryl-CoA dehydratase/vinylacetyl-CoA-Delta-isomerase